MGALRFKRPGDDQFLTHTGRPVPPLIDLGDLLSATDRIEKGKAKRKDIQLVLAPGGSLGGARPKATFRDRNKLHIAKFPWAKDEWPVIQWEAVLLKLAENAGVTVPPNRMVRVAAKPVLLMERFDRETGDLRLPFISAMTALDAEDGADDRSYLEILDAIRQTGAQPGEDARQLWRRMVFNVLVSNTDAVIDAFADVGVFRLRGVIVGTVAFQTYAGFLGVRLPNAAVRTGDLDLAQDYGVSVALNDSLDAPLLDVLKSVDPAFAPAPSLAGPNIAATYTRPGGYRVDVLTTNRGAERDEPLNLPSLQSDAVPLRFLDYLLKDTVEAAVLTRFGALANVPSPERYAVHKLIVSVMRRDSGESAVKADKDLIQAGILIEALVAKRRLDDLTSAFREAAGRGQGWKDRLKTATIRLSDAPRAIVQPILDTV